MLAHHSDEAIVNIWKSYIWTADKDVNMKVIYAVMNTSWAVVKIRLEKSSGLLVEVSIPAFWQLEAIQMGGF